MGRTSSPTPSGRPSADAVSLHTQPGARYLDDDAPEIQIDDDLPPEYSDHDAASGVRLVPAALPDDILPPRVEDAGTGAKYYLHPLLDTDPKALESHVNYWFTLPPRPHLHIKGTHKQTVDKNGKKERTEVVDFNITLDLTPYLFSDATNRVSWKSLRTVDNGEMAKRGTVFRSRAPGATQSIEVGGDAKPTLQEWCHLYCAKDAGLKSFVLRRQVVGLDEEKIKQKVESLVRGTNYRGHLNVSFESKDSLVEVYNDCKTNALRLIWWLRWVCVFTLLIVFTWPYLFFRTKRFEVVVADWPFSRAKPNGGKEYVSLSEDQWYNQWARAIKKAVLEKRQVTLDQQDLMAAEGAEPTFNTGHDSVDSAIGFLRAGVNAMNEVNRQPGWGGDC